MSLATILKGPIEDMSEFFARNIVVHTHIQKTAGTSLVRGFGTSFGKARVFNLKRGRKRVQSMSQEEKDRIYVLTGHFAYGPKAKPFQRTGIYLACVRSPLERWRSHYAYVKERPEHPGNRWMTAESFMGATEELLRRRPMVNYMSRVLTGTRNPDAGAVFASIERNYLIVSPHDRVNDTLDAIVPLFGGSPPAKEIYANQGNSAEPERLGELEARFAKANALDYDLYHYVQDHYEFWLQNLPARLDEQMRRMADR